MDFFAYYLYKGYSLYAESESGIFHYDRADKRWYPVDTEWDLRDAEEMKEIDEERAEHFL